MSTTDDTSRQVFHIELDISLDYRNDHAAFVILDALKEYADTERWRAEDSDNAAFLEELAATADRLHQLIDDQMCSANIREVVR